MTWRDGEGIRHNDDAEFLEDMDSLPFVVDVYQARSHYRELFYRISDAPVYVVLHGAGVPRALHLLSVAADHRHAQVQDAQRGACLPGSGNGKREVPTGEGVLL